jgi:hypothetical protein
MPAILSVNDTTKRAWLVKEVIGRALPA